MNTYPVHCDVLMHECSYRTEDIEEDWCQTIFV